MRILSKYTKELVTILFFITFIVVSIIIIYVEIPNHNRDIFLIMFGVLSGNVNTILNFWYGNADREADKDK
jgi:hypothetical protein